MRRLIDLASAMHDLARGNTGISFPGHGEHDEIGAMAEALNVFRSHLIENRRLTAERAAWKAPGVRSVDNRITVGEVAVAA